MKKKPHWFQTMDFLTFGLFSIIVTVLFLYTLAVATEGPTGWQYGFGATALGFWVVYIAVLRARKNFLEKFRWLPEWGLMVKKGEYSPKDEEINQAVSDTITAWTPTFPDAKKIVQSDVIWVEFHKDLDETEKNPAKRRVEGFTIAYSYQMFVDYDDVSQPLVRTAFEHELGHIIQGHATGKWDLDSHHERSKLLKLK